MNNNKWDFYYSRKLEKLCIDHYGENYIQGSFDGIPYTESIPHGREPLTIEMGDLIFLGTGTIDNMSFIRNPQGV